MIQLILQKLARYFASPDHQTLMSRCRWFRSTTFWSHFSQGGTKTRDVPFRIRRCLSACYPIPKSPDPVNEKRTHGQGTLSRKTKSDNVPRCCLHIIYIYIHIYICIYIYNICIYNIYVYIFIHTYNIHILYTMLLIMMCINFPNSRNRRMITLMSQPSCKAYTGDHVPCSSTSKKWCSVMLAQAHES